MFIIHKVDNVLLFTAVPVKLESLYVSHRLLDICPDLILYISHRFLEICPILSNMKYCKPSEIFHN